MKNKKNTILVTGGSGFIGSHLVDELVGHGESVVVIDKQKPKNHRKNKKATYIKMNIQDPGIALVFEKYQPSKVFHLAAHLHDRESVEKPLENAMDNVIGLLQVCEANRKTSKAKIVFMSSCAVYGQCESLPVSESIQAIPQTPYGISKLVGEQYLRFYHHMHGIDYVAFRAGNVYGPRQDSSAESGVIGIFASCLLCGKTAIVNNDGKTTRDYVYVSDVIDGLLRAADADFSGVLNIGTGIATKTKDIYAYVRAAVGVHAEPDCNELQQDAVKHMYLDTSKAMEVLGWVPQVGIEEGIKKTVLWYRDHNE